MALGDLHSRIRSPIVATYPIQAHYNTCRTGMLDQKNRCAKKFTTAGYPNPVQFHGSLNLSSALRYGRQVHLMKKPISIPSKSQVIMCVYMLGVLIVVVLSDLIYGRHDLLLAGLDLLVHHDPLIRCDILQLM